MTRRWFTSDLHIGHRLVSAIRGFGTLGEDGRTVLEVDTAAHDAAVAAAWDSVVEKDDHVYILGDLSISQTGAAGDYTFDWLNKRPGVKHLIFGNHDITHPAHSKAIKEQQRPIWRETFATMNVFVRIKWEGRTLLLSHFPYEGEGDGDGRGVEERFTEYRLKDAGHPLLYAHTHDKDTQEGFSKAGTPTFHVGLDSHGLQLVPEETIAEWISRV